MMYKRTRAISGAFVSAGVVGLLLSACSSSGGVPTGGGGGGNAGTATNAAATSGPTTQSANSALANVCKKGGSEGEVDYLTQQDPSVFAKEEKPFEAQYPDIKIKITQLEPQDQVSRVLAEIQAGHKLDADVLAPDPESALPLFKGHDVQQVNLGKYGINPNLSVNILGTKVYVTQRDFHGIGYNTKQYKASDLPSTWQGLVDSKLAGKISVDPRGKWIAPLVTNSAWGPTKTYSWYQKLLSTDKPQIIEGVSDSLSKVVSGEVPITTSARNAEVGQLAAGGAPVAIKYLDVIPVDEIVGTLLKNDPHPNAGVCLLAWLAGPVGQAQQLKYEFKTNAPAPPGAPANAIYTNDLNQKNIQEIANLETKMSAITK